MRDQFTWMDGLRDQSSARNKKQGLKEFILHHNRLGKSFIKAISKVIKFDNYLRVIDMQANKADLKTVEEYLLPSIRANRTLLNLDTRKNPCHTEDTQRIIALALLRNLEKVK